MKHPFPKNTSRMLLLLLLTVLTWSPASASFNIPANIDHGPLDVLLQEYVDEQGLIDYAGWKKNPDAVSTLDKYVEQFAPVGPTKISKKDKVASLINAYNAITIKWILDNYPTKSIRDTDKPWETKRWTLGGEKHSLNDIEHEGLRPLIGWAVHSAVVCAAISCPPLRNRAYTPENTNKLIDEAYIDWLKREDLNQFSPKEKRVQISQIFDWYSEDYKGRVSLPRILSRYSPEKYKDFLLSGKYKIEYLHYSWKLNEQPVKRAN